MAGQLPYDPYQAAGYMYPPPPVYVPTFGGVPPPQPERPPKEHCFYIKNKGSQFMMEVQNASVDPGTKIVMMPLSGNAKDSNLWFEDFQTGTIRSRLNLLCLDIEELSGNYQVVNSPVVPQSGISCRIRAGRVFYAAVAHTSWGRIPGRAAGRQCWYSYGGAEYCTAEFSWITAPNTQLVPNTGCPPDGAIGAGHQTDDNCTYYAAVAKSQWGNIPGKAKGDICWYAFEGKEHLTHDFFWIVTKRNVGIVNQYVPGKITQQWLRVEDKLQNRQDGNKVIEQYSNDKGSQVFSTAARNDANQKWMFVNFRPNPSAPTVSPPAYHDVISSGSNFVASSAECSQTNLRQIKKGVTTVSLGKPEIPQKRYFYIRSELHGKVLDVAGESKAAGAMAIMWPKKSPPADNQLWYLDKEDIIRSKLNDFCLQPSGHGIWLQPYSNKPNQMWMPQGRKIILKNNPNVCLDIIGAERKDGAKICQFKYKASPNQHWTFEYIN